MSSTIKINGNFFQLYDTATGDEIIRSNRANTTFSIDSSDVFSFYFDSPVKTQFPLGTPTEVYPFNFDFADLIDSRTGLAFVSVADLETYLSETLCGVLVGSDPLKEDKINKVSDFTVIDEITYPNTKAVVGLLSGLTAYFFYKTASAVVPAYYQMKTDPSGGALQTIVTAGIISGQKLTTFITNTGSPNITFLPSGVVRVNIHADKSVGTKDVQLYAVISKRILAGTETVIVTTGYSTLLPLGGASADYFVDGSITAGVPLLSTDLLLVDIYAYCPLGGSAPTITLGVEDNTAARLELPSGTVDLSGKENTANKQNSLTVDGTGVKFPTVDAVNAGLALKEDKILKDASGGYVGKTLQNINFVNVANTFTSFFTNLNTAARTYTFPNRTGTIADNTDLALKQSTSGKDASNGYAGLTLLKINFKNVANTFTSFFTNTNTAARTYSFQDRDGTIADGTDLALKENTANKQNSLSVDGTGVKFPTVDAVNSFGITVDCTDNLTGTFALSYAYKINSITNITGAPTVTILDDGAAYTLTNTIAANSVMQITANISSRFQLNIQKV